MRTPKWIKKLAELEPCSEGMEWAKQFRTAEEAWNACKDPAWMLWAIELFDKKDDAKLRLFACWCVRNTPLVSGKTVWDLLTDERSKKAVEVAEQFANGTASRKQLDAARDAGAAAWAAAWAAARAAAWAAGDAGDAARAAQANALRTIHPIVFKKGVPQ